MASKDRKEIKPQSVSDLTSKMLRPSLSSYFLVEIPFPSGDSVREKLKKILDTPNDQEKLNLHCSEASLPGSSLATYEINDDRTGVTERHAYRRIFDDRIDLTFYVDAEEYLPITFFETWMRSIVNEDIENIGARRLHTILEKVLEEISFTASEKKKADVKIDDKYVKSQIGDIYKDSDLTKFIL